MRADSLRGGMTFGLLRGLWHTIQSLGLDKTFRGLDIESELDHVAILDDIILSFDPQFSCFARFGEAA